MTQQEIDQAIENGESVWCVYKDQPNIYEIKAVEIEKVLSNTFLWGKEYYSNIKDVFKTKAEAEHYLHHANVERVDNYLCKWQKLKEWLKLQIDGLNEQLCDYDFDSDCREISIENFEIMLQQMQELEGEDV